MKHPIAIVDDHNLLSEAIGDMVDGFSDFYTHMVCKNGQEFLTQLKANSLHPKIVLMDVNMPILDGIQTTEILTKEYPVISVLALSVNEEDQTILSMLKAGAKGYLLKDIHKKGLEEALIQTIEKGYYHTNVVSNLLIDNLNKPNNSSELILTNREIEFIQLACSELTYKEIADKMCLSPKTIDNYRESVFAKFNVKNRVGLVLFAIKKGIWTTKG